MALHTLWRRSAPRNRASTARRRVGNERGFSLAELIVVTAIIVIVSSVVLAGNFRFGGIVKLENFAYDVALSIRQAQLFGISVARSSSDNFSAGFGIRVDMSNDTQFLMFADTFATNGRYDTDGCPGAISCELEQTTTMTGNYRIKKVCVTNFSGIETCSDVSGSAIFNNKILDIFFIRPEPNAWISAGIDQCVGGSGVCYMGARIQLKSPRDDLMDVVVDSSGQISVRHASS